MVNPDPRRKGTSAVNHSRVAQARRVTRAAEKLGIDPVTFMAWIMHRSARAGDPVEGWPTPWLIEVTTATRLRRDVRVVSRLREGWRLILTFHGRPFAIVSPITRPRPPLEPTGGPPATAAMPDIRPSSGGAADA